MARLRSIAAPFIALALVAALSCGPSRLAVPRTILWAWERPEDLRFLSSPDTAVAFLAAVISVQPDGYSNLHLRTQSLSLNPSTPLLAVARIESPPRHAPVNINALAGMLHEIAALPNVRALQIDFDARISERTFYKDLLYRIKSTHDPQVSITALASWCAGDRWLEDEPISEAVPMFFRMGRNESRNMPVESPVCLSSIGLSLDEPWPAHRAAGITHVYLFNPHAWTETTYSAAVKRLKEWK